MDGIFVISNNQILRDNIKSYYICDLNDINEQKIKNAQIIIFESDKEEEKKKLQLLLNKSKNQSFFLMEISKSQFTGFADFAKYERYLFFPKPISLKLLLNKIDELINSFQTLILLKNCQIDIRKRILIPNDKTLPNIKLTELEVLLISFLYNSDEAMATKGELLEKVWGYKNINKMTETGIVELTIFKIHNKLSEIGLGNIIENIGNLGNLQDKKYRVII